MSLGCPWLLDPHCLVSVVTFTALYKHHRDYSMSAGSSYSLNLCLTSPEESESIFPPNMDIAQRPWDFVNAGILLPYKMQCEVPGQSVKSNQEVRSVGSSLHANIPCPSAALGFCLDLSIPEPFLGSLGILQRRRRMLL